MKKLFISLLILAIVLPGCIGIAARDKILMPTGEKIYSRIYNNIDRGLKDGIEDGDLTQAEADNLYSMADALGQAFEDNDRGALLAIDWATLESWALRGIQDLVDDGVISEGVATSLYVRLLNFRDLLSQLGNRIEFGMNSGGTRAARYCGVYFGQYSKMKWGYTRLDKHNEPRRRLGVKELTELPPDHNLIYGDAN